jgi:hypothetical protein
MVIRKNGLVSAGVGLLVVACGASSTGASSGTANAGAIPSMPAYPAPEKAREQNPASPARTANAICADASSSVKVANGPVTPGFLPDGKGLAYFGVGVKGKDFSMADLQALEKKSAWEELLGHAEDVPPARRGAAWEGLVTRAAIGYIQSLGTNTAAYEGVFTSQALLTRYPHLLKSQEFMAKRGDAAKLAAERCLRGSYRGQHCIDMMKDFLKTSNTGPDVGFEFGKITRRNQNHYVAVPFFKWALDQKKDAAWCADDDLKLAVVAGLGLPPDSEEAAGARHIAASVCWDGLREGVRKQLQDSPDGYYRDNACAVLKAKGDL